MKTFLAFLFILLLTGCTRSSGDRSSIEVSEFKPPEDGKITEEQAALYVKASSNLMDAIKKHEEWVQEFIESHHLNGNLSELSDSVYCDEHPEVSSDWKRLQSRWKRRELKAYKRAGIEEESFDWIGSIALADTVNQDIQRWVQEQLVAQGF